MSRFFTKDRCLIAGSLLWVSVLLTWPGLASSPFVFVMTACLITANAGFSLWTITHQRRVLISVNAVQIVLFGFLNWQLYRAFGPEHFRFDRPPWFLDWIEFTAAHVLRAADFLDAIDEYGIIIQNVSHRSPAAGSILVFMHLTVDVFLIGLVLRWASGFWRDPPLETRLQRGRREFGWLLATVAFFVVIGIGLRLRPLDWVLWPIDQLIRLIDVGDVMQVFGWKLHSIESSFWSAAAGLLFRLCAGVWMARFIVLWRLTFMRTWGLSINELIELLDDPDAQMRRGAAEGLGQSGELARAAVRPLADALGDLDVGVRRSAAWALGQIGPEASGAAPRLVELAWLEDRHLRLVALESLRQIGPPAQSAVHDLVCLLKAGDQETRKSAIRALRKIAPSVLRRIEHSLCDSDIPRGWAHAAKLRRKKKRGTRKGRRDAAWQRSVEAAGERQHREHAIYARLAALLAAGFFDEERNVEAVVKTLEAHGETVEQRFLVLPFLRLTAERKLSRRRIGDGWIYRACTSSSIPL